ncbi:MAG TPA: hypothetical protein VFO52_05660 [Longimicrobiales bacterium]|nr:hypothetical protein [Longimicrobiales bacterium]
MTLFNSSGKRARLIGSVLLIVTFAAGALAGAAGERVLRADDAPQRARGTEARGGTRRLLLDEQFARDLQLTEQQRAQIKVIFERRDQQAKKVWSEAEPRLKAVGEETRAEIQKVLNAGQTQKLEAEIAKRHVAWRERHKCHSDSLRDSTARKQ